MCTSVSCSASLYNAAATHGPAARSVKIGTLIDHFNGIEAASAFLTDHGSACALSVITRAKVLKGFDLRAEPLARELLDAFQTLPINVDIADHAARLRRSERWKLPDALQAAVAMRHELVLVTRNTRDFQPGGSLEVLVPYQL